MPVANVVPFSTASSLPLPGDLNGQTVRQQVMQPAANNKTKPHIIHSTASDLEQIGLVFNKKLRFVVDHKSNEVTVKVIDKETDKVIKELPPEELQRLHSDLREAIGFLFDERV